MVALSPSVLWLCVCYFGLQTLAFEDKIYSQNNSTKTIVSGWCGKLNEMIKLKEFFLEESKVNKGLMILVAVDENDQKWVCSGDHWAPTYAKKYEDAFDTKPLKGSK